MPTMKGEHIYPADSHNTSPLLARTRPTPLSTSLASTLHSTMLFTTLVLPLMASAAVLQERDTAAPAVNVVVEKLEPRYRKTANRAKYKVGRKCSLPSNIDIEAPLSSHSIHAQRGFDQSGTVLSLYSPKAALQ
jgi:hypothetical protein